MNVYLRICLSFSYLHIYIVYLSISLSSLTSCKLGDDDTVYYVVGTGIVHPEEVEPKVGRLVIFTWADGKLTQVCFIYIYYIYI